MEGIMRNLIIAALVMIALPALAGPTDDQIAATRPDPVQTAQQLCLQFRVAPTTCDAPSRNSTSTRRTCAPDEPAEYDSAHSECVKIDAQIAGQKETEAAKADANQKKLKADEAARAIDASNFIKGVVGK
jgi:hypothetical protein